MHAAFRRRELLIVSALFALVCAAILGAMPKMVWSPDSDAKLVQLLNLRWDHGFHCTIPYPGRPWDPEMRAVPLGIAYYDVRNGAVEMTWPVLFAALSGGLFRRFGFFGLYIIPVLAGAGCVYAIGRLTELLRPGLGRWAALLAATGTPVFIYSILYFEHTAALLLTALATILLLRFLATGRIASAAGSTALMAFAASAMRGDVYLYAFSLYAIGMIFSSWRQRRDLVVWGGLAAATASLPGFAQNYLATGHLFPSNAVKSATPPSLAYVKEVGVWLIGHFCAGNELKHVYGAFLCVTGALVLFAFYWAKETIRSKLLTAALLLFALSAVAIAIDTLDVRPVRFHGWLAISPALLFGLLSAESSRSVPVRVLLLTSALYSLLLMGAVGITFPNGFAADINPEWGPRYWLPLFALLTPLAVVAMADFRRFFSQRFIRPALTFAGAVLVIVSIGMEALGVRSVSDTLSYKVEVLTSYREIVAASDGLPIASDIPWLPEMLPDEMVSRPVFNVDLIRPDVFQNWVPAAYDAGMGELVLVSFMGAQDHPLLSSRFEQLQLRVVQDEQHGHLHAIRLAFEPGGPETKI